MISKELFDAVVAQYAQNENGRHGIVHWARVLENGRRLYRMNGARPRVVELFALFHDSGRVTEQRDPGHGLRGAKLARALRGKVFDLDDEEFDLLYEACARHTDGDIEADLTVQTCWDADRLDLGRVSIIPEPSRLCTEAARDKTIIDWAYRRSIINDIPSLICEEWGIDIPG